MASEFVELGEVKSEDSGEEEVVLDENGCISNLGPERKLEESAVY